MQLLLDVRTCLFKAPSRVCLVLRGLWNIRKESPLYVQSLSNREKLALTTFLVCQNVTLLFKMRVFSIINPVLFHALIH